MFTEYLELTVHGQVKKKKSNQLWILAFRNFCKLKNNDDDKAIEGYVKRYLKKKKVVVQIPNWEIL